jgi:hypothetical protein
MVQWCGGRTDGLAAAGLRKRPVSSVALDHVGVVTRDLTALSAQYERLGFALTPFGRSTDGRIGNRCVMLRENYIELLAVIDLQVGSATLDRFIARYAGIHILAFAIDNPQSAVERLRRAGVEAAAVVHLDRAVDDLHPDGPRARFALIQTPDQPEGRINLVHHLTPEALWQERFLHHRNNAVALGEVVMAVAQPADTAARFSRLAGCSVVPDPVGGFALDLVHARVRMLPTDADGPFVPRVVGLGVRTADRNAAVGHLLSEEGIAHRREGDALIVDASAAGGVAICFVPGLPDAKGLG